MKQHKKLGKSLKKFSTQKINVEEEPSGELGIPLGGSKVVDVPTRPGYVYVRLKGNTSELIQAYNNTVPSIYDYPVRVRRNGNTYTIIGKDQNKWSNVGNGGGGAISPLPRHGGQHSLNPELGMGADVSWIYSRQFMNQLAFPSGSSSMMLTLEPWFYEKDGQWAYSQSTGTPSFAPYVPTVTGSARMALLYINKNTNALEIAAGAMFSGGINNPATLAGFIPDVDRDYAMPLAAVKLTTGTTFLDWGKIYDMRDFYTVQKRWGGIGIQDDGTPVGTGTILNFGNNLSVTVSNGVATINAAAGGGGGGGFGIMGWDEGIPIGTGTIINFIGDNVTATRSGTVINVDVSGGGSISTGTLDGRYLKLDTSNDPLQAGLQIIFTGTSQAGLEIQMLNNDFGQPLYIKQLATTGSVIAAPFFYGVRQANDMTNVVFNNPMLKFSQNRATGTITGGFLELSSENIEIIRMNPDQNTTGQEPAYFFDTNVNVPHTGIVFELRNYHNRIMHVSASGTVHSNGVPLVKEAPADGLPYVRRMRGWEVASTGTSSGGGVAIYPRAGIPTTLSHHTGTYWKVPEGHYISGSLAIFNQGHVLIPNTDYSEQYPGSGTYQYTVAQPTGTYHFAYYGVTGSTTAGGGGGSPSGGRTLIAESTPSGTSTTTISSSISGDYKKLTLEYAMRSTQAAANVGVSIFFNNDTTATNYRRTMHGAYGAGTSFAAGDNSSVFVEASAASSPAGSFSVGVIDIPQYANTAFNKHALCRGSHRRDDSSVFLVQENTVVEWESTSAITRVDITLDAGNFVNGSVFRLYGEN